MFLIWTTDVIWLAVVIVTHFHVEAVCDFSQSTQPGLLTKWAGSITSPGYEQGMYRHGQDCYWTVRIHSANKIKLTFQTFDLTPEIGGGKCEDFLKINDSSRIPFEKCGSLPSNFTKTYDQQISIYFHSDESGASVGFMIYYEGICEETILTSATLLSPNHPEVPPDEVTCTWKIGRPQQAITVKLLDELITKASASSHPCALSPIKAISSWKPNEEKSLCYTSQVMGYMGELTLKYRRDAKVPTDVWIGRIEINITDMPTITSASCPGELDNYTGSNIVWFPTPVTKVDSQTCPDDAEGHALRNCIEDLEVTSGALWTRPDLSMCSKFNLKEMKELIRNKTSGSISQHDLLEITSAMVNFTSQALKTSELNFLFPGDLLSSTELLTPIVDAITNISLLTPNVTDKIIEQFIATVDNVLDPSALNILHNAQAKYVEAMASDIVNTTQHFVVNIFRKFAKQYQDQLSLQTFIFQKFKARNLDIHIKQLTQDQDLVYTTETSSLLLSFTSFQRKKNSKGHPPHVYFARFFSVSRHYSLKEGRYKKVPEIPRLIISDVISAEVIDPLDITFNNLRDPVVITFLLKAGYIETKKLNCVFMNMNAKNSTDRWLTSGCFLKSFNITHVVCHCYHLTNFAVLMDIYDNQDSLSNVHGEILSFISYIGSGLSILSCLSLIALIQYFRISNDKVHIHQHLGISIIVTQALFLIMAGIGTNNGIPFWACYAVAGLLHYALMVMFCWMLVEGFHLYVKLVWVFKVGSYLKRYLIISWGCPLLVVVISMSVYRYHYKHKQLCWLDYKVLLICLVPVTSLILLINFVILVIIICVMLKSRNNANKKCFKEINNIKLSLKASLILMPLLGLTWVFAFLSVTTESSQYVFYIFTYMFTIINSCQGLLFFIFHGLLNTEIQSAFRRRYLKNKREYLYETSASKTRSPTHIGQNQYNMRIWSAAP
ncbi:hypothetical protein Btru_007900 [Bulinus truncatus]|nr:hypothetical protein Btru_007900 [Bulinus truncatus]